ncbi:porin family protein [Flavobacterium sp.]|uniref:porin family protein n=1 Tax=Flavobacterium sp. TaxID=239 RepID=UPI003263108A
MKKLLFRLTLLMTLSTYSQNSKIKFGFQGGLNYSNFRGYTIPSSFNQFYSESPAFAYLFGVNFEYKIQGKLGLKLELNYERKSQKADQSIELRENFDDPSQIYNFTSRKNYDYLILPILLKYNFTNKNSFYLNGGPFIGYLLKSKITNDLNAPGINSDDVDTTKDNKKTDVGISLGLGKNFDLGENKTINVEIRENLGLANTNKKPLWNGGNAKTNSINLIVGISFN